MRIVSSTKTQTRVAPTLKMICALCCVGLLVAACGGGQADPTPAPTDTPVPTTAPAPTAPPEEAAPEPTAEAAEESNTEANSPAEEEAAITAVELWNANACVACHNLDENQTDSNRGPIGPHLANLHQNAASRVDGQDALTYVIASIVEPNAYVNEGYVEGVMPQTYGEAMSEAEVEALAKWLLDPNREME